MFGHDQSLFMQLDAAIHAGRNPLLSGTVPQGKSVHPDSPIGNVHLVAAKRDDTLDQIPVPMKTDALGNKPVVSAIPVHFVVFRTYQHNVPPMYRSIRLHVDAQRKAARRVDDEKT